MANDSPSNGSNLLFIAGGLMLVAAALGAYARGVVGGAAQAAIGFMFIAIGARRRRRGERS